MGLWTKTFYCICSTYNTGMIHGAVYKIVLRPPIGFWKRTKISKTTGISWVQTWESRIQNCTCVKLMPTQLPKLSTFQYISQWRNDCIITGLPQENQMFRCKESDLTDYKWPSLQQLWILHSFPSAMNGSCINYSEVILINLGNLHWTQLHAMKQMSRNPNAKSLPQKNTLQSGRRWWVRYLQKSLTMWW